MTDQQGNIIFAFLQNLHIFVQINGRCANNRPFVILSPRLQAVSLFLINYLTVPALAILLSVSLTWPANF